MLEYNHKEVTRLLDIMECIMLDIRKLNLLNNHKLID